MTSPQTPVFRPSSFPFFHEQVLSKHLLCVLDPVWGIWVSRTEWGGYMHRMHLHLAYNSAVHCLFSCSDFLVAWTMTSKAYPWLGQGPSGTLWEESKPGTMEEDGCLLCCQRPSPTLAHFVGAGLWTSPHCPLSCMHTPHHDWVK